MIVLAEKPKRYRLMLFNADFSFESFLTKRSKHGRTLDQILKLLDTPLNKIHWSGCESGDFPFARYADWRLVEA